MTPDLSAILERAQKTAKVHAGPIRSPVAGRTDHLNMHVKSGSYVLPADIVSALGEGNTLNGFSVVNGLFRAPDRTRGEPYGKVGDVPYDQPAPEKARGGSTDTVPIVAAGGEVVLTPEDVMHLLSVLGMPGLSLDDGHKVLDEFVKQFRAKTIKTLSKLPGPRKN